MRPPPRPVIQSETGTHARKPSSHIALTTQTTNEPTTENNQITDQRTTQTVKSSSPYCANFDQNLTDGGVYPANFLFQDGKAAKRPGNWDQINQRLGVRRLSLSPSSFSEADFQNFAENDDNAHKEKQVTTSVIPIIEGKIIDPGSVCGGIRWTNLDPLTDGTIVPGNPDIYYGAHPEHLDRRVRDELRNSIIPSKQDSLPIVPNFFLAVKGPGGTAKVANSQALYNGALGERGMIRLLSFGHEKPVFDNNAHAISSTYCNGQLQLFTIHAASPTGPGGRPEYFMHRLRSFAMNDTPETFRHGAAAYRNARDWAKEQRDQAIEQANARVNGRQSTILGVETSVEQASSLTSEPRLGDANTKTPIQETRPPPTGDLETTINSHNSAVSSGELSSSQQSTKRLRRQSLEQSPPQNKRQNVRQSEDGDEHL
ncbi:hypothetical protein AYO20_06570 [Fonsecaea nubica]|uniref:Uncharacterized protein n=1 Tax=Fonsecaea nubica TaxID=856822 RepID=A0A178CZ01_9EURO|nr:hypothetical protein AYO20_06570 [Fonsecaea nubica]OAL34115.1 hypothetical protein AYO20_06570 [Fonsecaea nubica]